MRKVYLQNGMIIGIVALLLVFPVIDALSTSEERVPLYASKKTTFDIVGQLYALGLRGSYE